VTETDVVNASLKLFKELQKEDSIKGKKGLLDKLVSAQLELRKMDSGYDSLNKILNGGFLTIKVFCSKASQALEKV